MREYGMRHTMIPWLLQLSPALCCAQNKSHALNDEIVVNALAGVVGVGVTYIKDDEDIVPLLKASSRV